MKQIVVVDGSPPSVFAEHRKVLDGVAVHVPPDPHIAGTNGKVRGVLTGLQFATQPYIVVADDDVRYENAALERTLAALERADVVRPQNYFEPLPWHAILDTSRTLINRALDGDWPGTLAFRAQALPRGYDANVLFENLELVRTIRAQGGREIVARRIYVRRLSPSSAHFLSQRIRQAYDEFARPLRLASALTVLPVLAGCIAAHNWQIPVTLAGLAMAAAGIGFARAGGAQYFPIAAVFTAPLWVCERAICAWLAVGSRVCFGGMRYSGTVVTRAATPTRLLQRAWQR
ncbi:MAG: glycosyltransferase family 2 protein [Candidatus Baltobacteraceae bacterium]